MSGVALGMVLLAAVLHAIWNIAAKSAKGDATAFVWMYFTAGAVLCLPIGIVEALHNGAPPLFGILVAASVSGALHIAYSMFLQTGYNKADLGIVYPVARGVGPLLTMLIAIGMLGERPGGIAIAGGVFIVVGILVVTGRELLRPSSGLATGLRYGAATGAAIAAYTLWDSYSVGNVGAPPILYFGLSALAQSLFMLPWVFRKRSHFGPVWQSNWRQIVLIAVLSPAAYILVLYALTITSVALVAPVRESSIVVGALLAWWIFNEPHPARRIAGAVVVSVGIAAVALR